MEGQNETRDERKRRKREEKEEKKCEEVKWGEKMTDCYRLPCECEVRRLPLKNLCFESAKERRRVGRQREWQIITDGAVDSDSESSLLTCFPIRFFSKPSEKQTLHPCNVSHEVPQGLLFTCEFQQLCKVHFYSPPKWWLSLVYSNLSNSKRGNGW